MRQLSALDTQFLRVETTTTAAHLAGVAILDPAPGGAVTRDCLLALLRDRLHLAPPLRMRLADVPFGLDHPYWIEDPDLDLERHVHEVTLPAPGGERQLTETVARLHGRRLDRRRPLWEMHLIHGLSGGRSALYTKVHHCAVDGVSGAEILAALLDLSPDTGPRTSAQAGGPADDPAREPSGGTRAGAARAPDPLRMLAGAVTRSVTHPARAARSLARAAGELDTMPLTSTLPGARTLARTARTLTRFVTGDSGQEAPALPPAPVPRTSLNGRISADRVFSYGSLPLDDVKRVAKTFGISVNDVVMTLCSAALRAWLRERDALPDRPLVAAVPVAVRSSTGTRTVGNQISAMITPLATHLDSPRERLATMERTMRTAKRRFAVAPATWLRELSALVPSPLAGVATAGLSRLAASAFPPVNLIISNVPGPQFPLYLCGARVRAYYPLSVLTDITGGINITCFSYDAALGFGVVACPRRAPGSERLIGHLHDAMAELIALAETDYPEGGPEADGLGDGPGTGPGGSAAAAGPATPAS